MPDRKFTDEEELLILEMYKNKTTYKEMSRIVGKTVNVGNTQSLRKKYKVDANDNEWQMRLVLENKEKIIELMDEGWGRKDICKKLDLPKTCADLFYHYIDNFSAKMYHKVNPEMRKNIVNDYVENVMSVDELYYKYEIDPHQLQTILKQEGVLRNFKETRKLKKEQGHYNKSKNVNLPEDDRTLRQVSEKYRAEANYKCGICGKDNYTNIEECTRSLHVHHIVPYKISSCGDSCNLVVICQKCHNKVHVETRSCKEYEKTIIKLLKTKPNDLIEYFIKYFQEKFGVNNENLKH
jgi:hypothetical protein